MRELPRKIVDSYVRIVIQYGDGSSGGPMGSSGSGRISDYPGSSSSSKSSGSKGSEDGGAQDRCDKAFSARLEDVEQSEYYRAHGKMPPNDTPLEVAQRKRLLAQTAVGQSVGNLPTSFNYLASCMKDGWSYVGTVRNIASGPPVATISVDFVATRAK